MDELETSSAGAAEAVDTSVAAEALPAPDRVEAGSLDAAERSVEALAAERGIFRPKTATPKRDAPTSAEAQTIGERLGEDGDRDDAKQDGSKDVPADDPGATLDPTLRIVAKRLGWTNEQLNDTMRALGPEATERQLRFLGNSLSRVSERFAALGGRPQAPDSLDAPPRPQQSPQQSKQPSLLEKTYGADNMAVLLDKYGQDFFDEVLRPLEQNVLAPVMAMAERMREEAAAKQREQQVAEFNAAIKPIIADFGDFYGRPSSRDKEQMIRYERLLETADRIWAGATLQGVHCTMADAIEQAHILIAHDQIAANERKKIGKSVEKRAKSLTARPSQRSTQINTSQENPLAAAEESVRKKLQEIAAR